MSDSTSTITAKDSQILKLHVEIKILKRKNSILKDRCEEATSTKKYLTSRHKLETDKHQHQINELKQQIQHLKQLNIRLTTDCNVLKDKLNNYKQKNQKLTHEKLEKIRLSKKLKHRHIQIKNLKQQNTDMKRQLEQIYVTEINPKQIEISSLKTELHKLHEIFDKNKMRKVSNAIIRLRMSDSTNTKRLSTINSNKVNKPRFYVSDSYNMSKNSMHYKHRHLTNTSVSNLNVETCQEDDDKHDNMYTIYQQNKTQLYKNDKAVRAYWISDYEMDSETNTVFGFDYNKFSQDLVILDAYNVSAKDVQCVVSPLSIHSSPTMSLMNSETEKAEDVYL
eukprot:385576_1